MATIKLLKQQKLRKRSVLSPLLSKWYIHPHRSWDRYYTHTLNLKEVRYLRGSIKEYLGAWARQIKFSALSLPSFLILDRFLELFCCPLSTYLRWVWTIIPPWWWCWGLYHLGHGKCSEEDPEPVRHQINICEMNTFLINFSYSSSYCYYYY